MTTVPVAQPELDVTPNPRSAMRRHSERRRRRVEKLLAAMLLLAAFAITVVLLGLQWLGNQGSATSAPIGSSQPGWRDAEHLGSGPVLEQAVGFKFFLD
jgi:hypothetical protein